MRKRLPIVLIFIMLLFLLISCNRQNHKQNSSVKEPETLESHGDSGQNLMTETADKLGITHENYPTIDGSTSTLAIVRAINNAMYQSYENDNYPNTASKTVPSYNLLLDNKVDMVIVPYASSEILNRAEEKGIKLEFYPVAAEALIFITPKENPSTNITMDQVRSIYLDYGIKNWLALGGPDRELVPICRNADSGSQSQMDNLILEDKKMHSSIRKNYVELTMEGMLEQVAFYHGGGLNAKPTNSYALGYTLYTYLMNMGQITGIDERLNILAFEGVAPNEESIASGVYPLTDAYYAVIRKDLPLDHGARKLISWFEQDETKPIIKDLGLIPTK